MIRFPFFKRRDHALAALFGDIVAAARAPEVFRDHGVTDDFEGRFEYLALIATLVLRRLGALPAPAAQIAQDLVDMLFAHLDDGLRRAGISDLAVGKRMKKLAQGFYGRAEAYSQALAKDDVVLRMALARNLYGSRIEAEAVPTGLLAGLWRLVSALDTADCAALVAGGVLASANEGRGETQ